jgi:outer membrane protein TolC
MIGATEAELYPAFSLSGTFGFLSTDICDSELSDVFDWQSRVVSFGPAVVWNVFNYGQITNQVRAQDAAFQQAVLFYQNAVLQAQQEVEDGLVSFLGSQESVALLTESVAAARRSVELATIEYREGATDYTTVLSAQQNLLEQQDELAVTEGDVAQGLISLYRALGGGWQTREGDDFVRADIKEAMAGRTDWGRAPAGAAFG